MTTSIEDLIEQYLQWMRVVRNAAHWTTEAYRTDLKHFRLWLAERGVDDVRQVNESLVERYQHALFEARTKRGPRRGERLAMKTQHKRLAVVSAFFQYLSKQRVLERNPAVNLELPRLPPKLPVKPLTIDEAELVLLQPDVGTPKGLRDRALLEVLFATAIRRAELINLRIGDIDPARGTLFVCNGKGGKQRIVPISERAIHWVNKYLSEVRPLLPASTKTSALFLTMQGGALTYQVLHDAVHGYIKSAEIGRQGSCHIFRHTVATLLLEGGADLRYVQEMLGHASPTTTQIYTRVTITSLKEAYEKAHPATAAPSTSTSED